MRKGKVFFNPIDGSAPLSISWSNGPKGDAVEAENELGVGFFSETGDLLGVIFDNIEEKKDYQVLKFDGYEVELTVERGRISFKAKSVQQIGRKHKKTTRKRKAA